ncbi:MAG: UDP-N-acetyl-D-mannosamine dehydrogenase, partial [Nonlabens sp.]
EYYIVEPNIASHKVFKLTDYKEAFEKADIVVYLVAHKEFSNLPVNSNKIVLDFAGVNK